MPTYNYLNDTGLERTLRKLKTYIDSQSGGGSDGHGFIICDTSTMQVGDRIRVRSVYTVLSEQYNQTKEVVTVGQPVTFTVPCYDYYKICTVQTIDDTPTEIGGVYKTVDYGQTFFIDVLDKTSLAGIQGILNAHQEGTLLAIGDESHITVGGNEWGIKIAKIDDTNHIIDFASNIVWNNSIGHNATGLTQYPPTKLRDNVVAFFNEIGSEYKPFIKEVTKTTLNASGAQIQYNDKIWIPSRAEATGDLPIFLTQANRIRKNANNEAVDWWTSTAFSSSNGGFYPIHNDGQYQGSWFTWGSYAYNTSHAILPCFSLTADA